MVGGLADWFAVTASFRRPARPADPAHRDHSGQQDRIADTMAAFLRDNFLTAQSRGAPGPPFQHRGGDRPHPRRAARRRAGPPARLCGEPDRLMCCFLARSGQLAGWPRRGLRRQLERLNLAPLLGQLLTTAIADKRHWPGDRIVHPLGGADDRGERGSDSAASSTNAPTRCCAGPGSTRRSPAPCSTASTSCWPRRSVIGYHPIRARFEEGLETLARDLLHDPAMQDKVAEMKHEVLANPAMGRGSTACGNARALRCCAWCATRQADGRPVRRQRRGTGLHACRRPRLAAPRQPFRAAHAGRGGRAMATRSCSSSRKR